MSGIKRGSCQFSKSAALEILDYYANNLTFLKETDTLMISALSGGESLLLESCLLSLGAKPTTIESCGHLSNTLVRSATPIAQKLVAEGIQIVGHETVPPSALARIQKRSGPLTRR
jgi:hypothetical protein